ncbi:hypothetical protein [Paraburkholderia sp. SIMBA_054]|uniref:hypothetical protein n=1 Tax=Paraburkholderia sp. SIMBA_054 TaxID=3085795 RepID=UPI00397E58EF
MNILALNAGIAAGVGMAWFATEWARLRHTPALSHESKRNGIRGEYLDAGPAMRGPMSYWFTAS